MSRLIPVFFAVILAPPGALAAGHVEQALGQCREISEADERLACYDAIAEVPPAAVPEAPPAAPSAEAPATAAAAAAAVSAEEPANDAKLERLGSETLPSYDAERKNIAVQARVVRCLEQYNEKFLFYFDNGQVWKQKTDKRLTYDEDCRFDITISKDFFGYKMETPEGRTIRISRVK